jgi:hypothetical protein
MPLVVTKIDTAAGEYIFQDTYGKPQPVVVALIVPDSAATTKGGDVMRCDDTCMWANDGVCDDGSKGRGKDGDARDGAWWEDDDLGGWYSDEREDTDEFDQYDYGYMYDDSYGYYGDDAAMPACIAGTDCTDCGGPLEFMAEDDDADADAGDWDDDEWFDDDTEEWWDDDYDFGEEWDGFEDDEKDGDGPIGIISSVQPSKKPNKRHMTKEQREALKHGSGGFFDVAAHPAAAAGAALAALVLAAVGCLSFCKKEEGLPTENPCLGGKRKQAQA